jgi:DNA-directed RNA polymerase specialized sigma24 family protein
VRFVDKFLPLWEFGFLMPLDASSPDELLRRFVEATDEAKCARLLAQLIGEHAAPLWETILGYKFHRHLSGEDFTAVIEDLQSACKVALVRVLYAAKAEPEAKPIRHFKGYAAVMAHNAYAGYWRRRAPQRESLRNKVRYLLRADPRFAVWQDEEGEKWCGWESGSREPLKITLAQLADIVKRHEPRYAQIHLRELAAAMFNHAGGALRVDDVTDLTALLWGVKDAPPAPLPPAPPDGTQARLERLVTLAFLWREIKELPSRQRKVLLYHLRDDESREMVSEWFHGGLANGAELAGAFEITRREFYDLLPELPWTDEKIGALLKLEPQQVSNLRRAARDNLRRRLAGKQKRAR